MRDPTAEDRVKEAVKRREAAKPESIEDAWQRILSMKNSDIDAERLREVRKAMAEGAIGRHPSNAAKRFSKAEALRMWAELAEARRAETLRKMVESTPAHYVLVCDEQTLESAYQAIAAADIIAIDCETFGENDGALDPWTGNMAGFSVSTWQKSFYIPLNHTERTELTEERVFDKLRGLLESKPNVMHNAPFDCKWFYVKYGVNLIDSLHADTRIMAMAFDENRSHRLKDLCSDWLGVKGDNFDQLFARTPFNEIPLNVALAYAAGDTEKTLKLYDWIRKFYAVRDDLKRIERLVFDIEMPVCRQFIRADLRGVRFDSDMAHELDANFEREEIKLQARIFEMFGEEINLNSPTQLSKKLFSDLKLPDYDKGSTGVRTLKRIKKEHPVIPLILEYREVEKLRQAFTSKLPETVKFDGKIHPWHNTWGAATGRFTCNNPNTQQIPAKRPEIRKLFMASGPDRILVSIDYSQIELRVLAHYAKDPVLIEAFRLGRDIHSTTAAQVNGVTYEQIEANKDVDGTKEQKWRKQAKTINFGIIYGMGAAKLADTLEISREEAEEIIDNYFKAYPGIKAFMDTQKDMARKKGYVVDILGRKRRLAEEFKAKDRYRIFAAERQAANFVIQSSAGSILKKAVVDLENVLPKMGVFILTQTHDEILYDCPKDITREYLYQIRRIMAEAIPLEVPVNCDIEIYPERWMEKVSEEEWFA